MPIKIDVVTASPIGQHIAVVCRTNDGLTIGALLSVANKKGQWKVTSLGWPTLAQAQGKVATNGIVLLPSEGADSLQAGDVLLGEQVSKAAA